MQHQSSQPSPINKRDFSNTSYIEVNQNLPQNQINPPYRVGVEGAIGFIIGGAFLMFLLSKLHKSKQSNIVVNLQQLNEIPCNNCRFFSSNPYVKCAVHPAIALTKEAINCADYCPQARKNS